MTFLKEGDTAPDFTLPKSGGGSLSLKELRGRDVVLYFYPKDDTPGCTKQACDLRDDYTRIEAAGAVVLGISPDGVASHERFADKYGLPFALLADTDHRVADRYGAWTQKSMMGKKYMGIQRSTYLIDGEGTIRKVWHNVKAFQHGSQIRESLGIPV